MSVTTKRGIRRRELLTGGLAAGAGAVLLGRTAAPRAAGAATSIGPSRTGTGSTGESESLAAPIVSAMPPAVAGARMVGLYSLSFTTWIYGASEQATPLFASGKGTHVSGAGQRLQAVIPAPAGARIVRLDYFGYRDTPGSQTWWFSRRDPTTFGVTDLISTSLSGTGALTGSPSVDELVLPGYDYTVTAQTSSGDPYVRGAVVQYVPPVGDFVAITPKRVYDSRVAGGRLATGEERTVPVALELGTTNVVVPSGARAVAVNLTVDQTALSGWLSIRPAGTAWSSTSNINWTASGATLANGCTSSLGGDRQLTALVGGGGSAHFLLDVVGYYL